MKDNSREGVSEPGGTKLHSVTMALCPICRSKIAARIVEHNNKVYLDKFCPQHGSFSALICSDVKWYLNSVQYVKPGQKPLALSINNFKGCPESCGLCPQHQQHSCMPVIEITHACNLDCPICLKELKREFQMSLQDFGKCLDLMQRCEGDIGVINLSGGEPTLHPLFGDFLKMAAERPVLQITVSTNGLAILENSDLRNLFKKYDALVALQFDGFKPETYRCLRGEDLSAKKLKLIALLEEEGIRYSLVSTVLKGVNDCEIGQIANFFFKSKAHSLMFQPATFTGSGACLANADDRLTIPDVIREIAQVPLLKRDDFNPLPCSHYSCFALAYYFMIGDGEFLSLRDFLGKEDYLKVISNRTLPGLDRDSYSLMKEKIYEFWSASDSSMSQEKVLKKIRSILKEIGSSEFSPKKAFTLGAESMKAIYIHQFMDVHTFDFGRVVKCCNHYPHADGRLIPMCIENVFEAATQR